MKVPSISSFTADDTTVSLTTSSQTQTVTFTCVATDNVAVSTVSLPGTTDTGSSEIVIHLLKHMSTVTIVLVIVVIH